MTFTFPRISAGIYEVQKNDETVGFIRKVNPTKWMIVDVVDTPQHVCKSLKESKDACVNLIIFDTNTESDVEDKEEVVVNDEPVEKVEGSLNTYSMTKRVRPSYFGFEDTEEDKAIEYVAPSYSHEPTLDPIEF
jgi:exosome complex RNA-binding protein Rrp4